MSKPRQSQPARKRERRHLRDLTPHPDCQIFAAPLDFEIENLASDIQSRGLQHPIEISPHGVIIAGLRRWLALRQLGHESTICVVRHDLAETGEIAILEHLVKDNTVRRHPTDLEVARGHYVVESDRVGCGDPAERTLDAVALHLKISGVELSRLCHAVTTPRVIQDAVDAGAICLADAAKISMMPFSTQQEISSEIMHGEPPNEVIQRYCGPSAKAELMDYVPSAASSSLHRAATDLAGCAADLFTCDSSAQRLGQVDRKMITNVVRRLTALLRQA